GPLFVSMSILFFALTIRSMGLVVTGFASFIIAALGTPEMRWKETIIVGICLTAGCSLLFPYALGLPLQLFPRFLIQGGRNRRTLFPSRPRPPRRLYAAEP